MDLEVRKILLTLPSWLSHFPDANDYPLKSTNLIQE